MGVLKAWDSAAGAWLPVAGQDSYPISRTLIDAKGDLLAGTAADIVARLSVGADHTFLQASASESTGVKWGGATTSYNPTFGVGITPGNGTSTGEYLRVGQLVVFEASLTFGTTTSMGSNYATCSLPVAGGYGTAQAWAYDNGNSYFPLAAALESTVILYRDAGSTWGTFTSSTPFSWNTGDVIHVSGVYLA